MVTSALWHFTLRLHYTDLKQLLLKFIKVLFVNKNTKKTS